MTRDVATRIRALASERILVLDGAWGVLLQSRGLTEADFRGERFAGHPRDLLNDPDLLNLTRPDIVRSVHSAYFDAGVGHMALRLASWDQQGQFKRFLGEVAPAFGGG